jgi:putative aldouronate transport system substrate-binding protein
MKKTRWMTALVLISTAMGILEGCGGTENKAANDATKQEDTGPIAVSLVIPQVNDIPTPGNTIQQGIEKYTNTKLSIQWVPNSTYDEKINVMIASNEMPKHHSSGPVLGNYAIFKRL